MTTSPGPHEVPPTGATSGGSSPPHGGATAAPAPPSGTGTSGAPSSEPSIGELIGNISNDFSTLVRQELDLAKAEISQTVSQAGKGAGMFGGAGLAGYFALLFLSLALWWALGAWIGDGDAQPALGWSALIVAVLWAVVAAVLAVTGRKEMKEVEGLPQTSQTVKKIPDAVKGQDH